MPGRRLAPRLTAAGALALAAVVFSAPANAAPTSPATSATSAEDRFALAISRMDAGQTDAAADLFEKIYDSNHDSAAALLGGICRYELGQPEAARRLLTAATSDPTHRHSADFFLGLIALDGGRREDARRLFSEAKGASSLEISRSAADLARVAAREGRLSVQGALESRYDSNLNLALAPDGRSFASPVPDLGGAATGDLLLRPFGETGPFAGVSGKLSRQLTQSSFDSGGGGARAGVRLGPDRLNATATYRISYELLGPDPFLFEQEGRATGRAALGRFTLRASYRYAAQSYLHTAVAGYSGAFQEALAGAEWRAGNGISLELSYLADRRDARDPSLAAFEHGPSPTLRLRLSSEVELKLDGAFAWRWYDSDPAGVLDQVIGGNATLSVELGDQVTMRAYLTGTRVLSSTAVRAYGAVSGGIGFTYSAALL